MHVVKLAKVKWYSLQGVPDTGDDHAWVQTDAEPKASFVELPAVGAIQARYSSTSTQCVTSDLASESSFVAKDNRERFAPFSTVNDFSTHESTFESEPRTEDVPQPFLPVSVTLPTHTVRKPSDSEAAHSCSDVPVSQSTHVTGSPQESNAAPLVQDPDGTSTLLGDSSMLSVSTLNTTHDSFFRPHPVATSSNVLARSLEIPVTAQGGAHNPRSTPENVSTGMALTPEIASLTLSSSTLTEISDFSASDPSVPQVDQLWERLQALKVTSETGLGGGKSTTVPGERCVCDQFRQLGVETLTALVESLKTGPVHPPRTAVQTSGMPSTSVRTSSGQVSGHSAHFPGSSQASDSSSRPLTSNARTGIRPPVSMSIPAPVAGKSRFAAFRPNANRIAQNTARFVPPSSNLSANVPMEGVSHASFDADGTAAHRANIHPVSDSMKFQRAAITSNPLDQLVVLPDLPGTTEPGRESMNSPANPEATPKTSSQWYFYPMGNLYTTPSPSREPQPSRQKATAVRPTLIPLSLQDAFRQQMGSFVARSRARQRSLAVAKHQRLTTQQLRSSDDDEISQSSPYHQHRTVSSRKSRRGREFAGFISLCIASCTCKSSPD